MAARAPVRGRAALLRIAERTWWSLGEADHLEAFAAHPKIGEAKVPATGDATWSTASRPAPRPPTQQTLAELAEREPRATRRKLRLHLHRLRDGPHAPTRCSPSCARASRAPRDDELRTAAEEQAKITRLRLGKLIGGARMITTHVLDTALGKPGKGIAVELERVEHGAVAPGRRRRHRRRRPPAHADRRRARSRRARTASGSRPARTSPRKSAGFFPVVEIQFTVVDGAQHYHVPLLLSPYSYSTYRGS